MVPIDVIKGRDSNIDQQPGRISGTIMKRTARAGSLLAACAVFALAALWFLGRPQPGQVIRVVDGDTIVVYYDGRQESVRLLRIDTPERGQKGYREATEALRALVGGRVVELAFEDPGRKKRDAYGRLLAYVLVDDRNANVEMVRLGWSTFWTKFGAGRLAAEFRRAEREARAAGRGLWVKRPLTR